MTTKELLHFYIKKKFKNSIMITSSFGAESIVILHLCSRIEPNIPILFLNTGKLFKETLVYLKRVKKLLKLTNIKIYEPDELDLAKNDPKGKLHLTNTALCCNIRKVEPLKLALREGNYKAWINGRKRFHGKDRNKLKVVEYVNGVCKINPLANWTFKHIENYCEYYKLPKHPLVAKGYMSIGCKPCTSKTKDSIRDGRWANSMKSECGIHENRDGSGI